AEGTVSCPLGVAYFYPRHLLLSIPSSSIMSCLPLPVFTFATTVVKDATADYAGMTLWSALLSVAVHRSLAREQKQKPTYTTRLASCVSNALGVVESGGRRR